MTWAALAILTLALTVTLGTLVFVAAQFRQALEKSFHHTDRMHDRAYKALSELLDRFMALDFATFKSYQAADQAPEGEFIPPPRPVARPEDEDGGFISPVKVLVGDTTAEERAMLERDFPEEMLG